MTEQLLRLSMVHCRCAKLTSRLTSLYILHLILGNTKTAFSLWRILDGVDVLQTVLVQ